MTTFATPLSKEDASVIAHAFELFIVTATSPYSGMDDVERYSHARMWMRQLFQGYAIDIPEEWLTESRRIMTQLPK